MSTSVSAPEHAAIESSHDRLPAAVSSTLGLSNNGLSKWFADEVQPHERSLRSYLRGAFPGVRDLDDVVQESYLRIFRAKTTQRIESARAFLFGIARRLALDCVRRNKTATHPAVKEFNADRVLEDGPGVAETVSTRQEMALLAEAVHALPARCREILILRKLEGLPQREIAGRLGIAESTVEVQVSRGLDKCADFLARRGVALRRKGTR